MQWSNRDLVLSLANYVRDNRKHRAAAAHPLALWISLNTHHYRQYTVAKQLWHYASSIDYQRTGRRRRLRNIELQPTQHSVRSIYSWRAERGIQVRDFYHHRVYRNLHCKSCHGAQEVSPPVYCIKMYLHYQFVIIWLPIYVRSTNSNNKLRSDHSMLVYLVSPHYLRSDYRNAASLLIALINLASPSCSSRVNF